jgi:hypothetical protein
MLCQETNFAQKAGLRERPAGVNFPRQRLGVGTVRRAKKELLPVTKINPYPLILPRPLTLRQPPRQLYAPRHGGF